MRRVIAVAFALFGFASQASADCSYTASCPIDGKTAVRDGSPCEVTENGGVSCRYEHQTNSGEYHHFWVTNCK